MKYIVFVLFSIEYMLTKDQQIIAFSLIFDLHNVPTFRTHLDCERKTLQQDLAWGP